MPDHHDQHHHHNHDLSTVHYDISTHDDFPRHHHEWSGNHYFVTCLDVHDHWADDHDIVTGDDHNHPGFDYHFHGGGRTPTHTTH